MNVIETKIPGVLIIEPQVFYDSRGWFMETYSRKKHRKLIVTLFRTTIPILKVREFLEVYTFKMASTLKQRLFVAFKTPCLM